MSRLHCHREYKGTQRHFLSDILAALDSIAIFPPKQVFLKHPCRSAAQMVCNYKHVNPPPPTPSLRKHLQKQLGHKPMCVSPLHLKCFSSTLEMFPGVADSQGRYKPALGRTLPAAWSLVTRPATWGSGQSGPCS